MLRMTRRFPGTRTRSGMLVLALLAGLCAASLTWQRASADEAFTTMPIRDLEGRTRNLDEWAGQLRLVNFWATWCAPCRVEMPLFQDAYERHRDRKFVVIGIALDEPGATSRFRDRLGITYPLLIMETPKGMELMTELGNRAGAVPFSLLLSPDGDVLDRHLGVFDEASLEKLLERHLGKRSPDTQTTHARSGSGR